MYFKIIKELNSYYLFFKNFKLIYLNKNFIEVFKKSNMIVHYQILMLDGLRFVILSI